MTLPEERGAAGAGATSGTAGPVVIRERGRGVQPLRRLAHATLGALVVHALTLFMIPSRAVAAFLGALFVVLLAAEGLRLASARLNRIFCAVLGPFLKPSETHRITSSTWYVLGMALALALFPGPVAVPAILVLALADPAATVAGKLWGGRRVGDGTVAGSLAFAVVAFFVLRAFVPVGAAGLVALVGALAERVPRLDDNVTIPLATGAALLGVEGLGWV